ncbi:hypothetical protein TRFO_29698 [Tritrichomonas foetus]|uniref:BTB domain-containing protein n=1 Tax=Tritrichomonas foetus TaxID=1144522 RepID=A0A1J4JZS5_9EUKA|nr:hypothetical protein TRFO_29698 [Tritrichomonas foetus]|eukprot:OHT02998.1 hypothetical protein TRFO_29698 [Tritrichomonas foetus]
MKKLFIVIQGTKLLMKLKNLFCNVMNENNAILLRFNFFYIFRMTLVVNQIITNNDPSFQKNEDDNQHEKENETINVRKSDGEVQYEISIPKILGGDDNLYDFTIIYNGASIKTNKLILLSKCKYFSKIPNLLMLNEICLSENRFSTEIFQN